MPTIKNKNSSTLTLLAPKSFLARIKKNSPADPLLRQILPLSAEKRNNHDYSLDPLQEKDAHIIPGLLHKYYGRVLLLVNDQCPIKCRFCFRQHFPFSKQNLALNNLPAIISYLRSNKNIEEVILSGGEPLTVAPNKLNKLVNALHKIPHIKKLRIHTRLPIVMPEAISAALLKVLLRKRLQIIMVIHCNHANEINNKVRKCLAKIRSKNIFLLNQSVLLKGVNDSVEDLANLSQALFKAGVLPYYLHMLDKVLGTAHFAVAPARARLLMREVTNILPGYLVPKLVCEKPKAKSKQLIG